MPRMVIEVPEEFTEVGKVMAEHLAALQRTVSRLGGGKAVDYAEIEQAMAESVLGAARNGAISGGIRRSQGASFGRAHWRGSVRTLHKLLYCCCRSRRSWVMIADTAPADDAPADGLHCKGCMDARCPHCRHEHTQPRQRPGVRCDRNPCQTLSVIHSSLSC